MAKTVLENIGEKIKVCVDGVLPLLSAICDKIGLVDRIDENIEAEQENRIVTSGTAIKAMVMNIVADRKALYKLDEFYEETDTEKMFGEGINARNLTDDVMARALNELYEIGPKKVMTETAMNIIKEYDIPVKSVHADTTSKSLYGEYKECEEVENGSINITRGHSKDKRPDLKQILFGLGTTKDRIIVIGDVCDGNTSDKEWNKNILKELRLAMKEYGLSDFIYVADSAAVTEEMLNTLAGEENTKPIPFVSRLPGNYKLEEKLKQKAIENVSDFKKIGKISDKKGAAEYKLQSFEEELHGRKYRFIVCHSSMLDTRKKKTINSKIEAEKIRVEKAIKEFEKIEFYCEKDAKEALQRFKSEQKLKYHELIYKTYQKEKRVKRNKVGRPKKNEDPQKEIIYYPIIKIYEDDEVIKDIKDRASMFVLITSILDKEEMTDSSILKEYKEQSSVETCFRVLKDPYFIDELFLEKPHRVEAMSYIMLIALMVLTLLERTIRENLKVETERVVVSGKRKTFTPTGVSIIEAFERVQVMMLYENGRWHRHCKLNDNLKRLIRLAGFNESIYTEGFKKIG